jgi:hypothetical protein
MPMAASTNATKAKNPTSPSQPRLPQQTPNRLFFWSDGILSRFSPNSMSTDFNRQATWMAK